MQGAQARLLPDGVRLHLHHGPIDLIIGVEGAGRDHAFARATARFQTVLEELVAELAILRDKVTPGHVPNGRIARAMADAVLPHADRFVTPMAAVAGAVADAVLAAMCEGGTEIRTAYVNNGGDVAMFIAPGHQMRAAIAGGPDAHATIAAHSPVRGVATSGWRGRSHSLGIADAVTVLGRSAAMADVAATLIANAVDLPGHPAIRRVPACDIAPDSDLGRRAVTVDVGALSSQETARALARGERIALSMRERGLIEAAMLSLNAEYRTIGACVPSPEQTEPCDA